MEIWHNYDYRYEIHSISDNEPTLHKVASKLQPIALKYRQPAVKQSQNAPSNEPAKWGQRFSIRVSPRRWKHVIRISYNKLLKRKRDCPFQFTLKTVVGFFCEVCWIVTIPIQKNALIRTVQHFRHNCDPLPLFKIRIFTKNHTDLIILKFGIDKTYDHKL